MISTILDCYTDEPAGLGVPPYLGVYPRYIAGAQKHIPNYLTIDDLRLLKLYNSVVPKTKENEKTDIRVYNLTKNYQKIDKILSETTELIIILGVHTPGKYLSAIPGTLNELKRLLEGYKCKKIITGPVIFGSQLHGGRFAENIDKDFFEMREDDFSYEAIKKTAIAGAQIIEQVGDERIIEIETSRGCNRKDGCSFCLEPVKNRLQFRDSRDIVSEIKEFHKLGVRHFRLGKQSCIYAYPGLEKLLRSIRDIGDIRTLHIDNANPQNVINDHDHSKTKAIVKYCTEGNVAAFGVESFDPKVIKANNLNSDVNTTLEAVRILNSYGRERGSNGMPKLLPGINILLGLEGESRLTFELNLKRLHEILDEGLLLRRINIRKVIPFEGTALHEKVGNKFLRKNNRFYYSFRRKVREEIDNIMLRNLVPKGSLLTYVRAEIYDGKTTFGRQFGSYPLIVGVKGRLPLKEYYNIRVTGYMLRSIIGEAV